MIVWRPPRNQQEIETWRERVTYRLNDVFWDDLKAPATAINPPGTASDPGRDTSTGLLVFDATSTELVFLCLQMPHAWKEGTEVKPHVHWYKTTSASGDVAWRCRYKLFPLGEVGDSSWNDLGIETTPSVTDNDTALQHALTAFDSIDMTGKGISDMILFEVSRVGGDASDTYVADAALLEFDIHYQIDQPGSRKEYIK